jgi:hypothetical protein
MTASTRVRALPLTCPPLSTRDTVLAPTPACAATSAIVTVDLVLRAPGLLEVLGIPAYVAKRRTGGAATHGVTRSGSVM